MPELVMISRCQGNTTLEYDDGLKLQWHILFSVSYLKYIFEEAVLRTTVLPFDPA